MGNITTDIHSSDPIQKVFQIGEKVVHIPEGVCTITEITKMDTFGTEKDYYKLVPVMDNTQAIYVGINSPAKYVRHLRSKEEIQMIMKAQKESKKLWEKNEEKRNSQMKTAIQNDDGIALAKLIKTYYQKRKLDRLNTNDSNQLKKAEQFLYSEIAEVLHKDYNKLRSKILE